MGRRNTSAAAHQHRRKMHHSLSTNKLQVLRAEMRHKTYQITTSPFLDLELGVEHHHPSREAELILLHMRGSKWLLRNHLQGRKLILSNNLFLDRQEATRTLLFFQ
jgi:hypothetical protein